MKKALVPIVLVLIVVCAMGGLFVNNAVQAARASMKPKDTAKVEKGEILVKVVESGTVDAVKSVEVRSRASGRLKELMVDEGAEVYQGQLIALIDPQETELRVRQDRAQVRGASSGVSRTNLEIQEQRRLLNAQLGQAQTRLASLRDEVSVQPTLTRTAIDQAKAQLESARKARATLVEVTLPNQRTDLQRSVDDARTSYDNAERDLARQLELEAKGYVAGRTVENARLQVDLAKTRLGAANLNLERLAQQEKLQLQQADEDIRSAQAAYDRAIANRIQDAGKRREYQQAVLDVERARASLMQVSILQQSKAQSLAQVDQLQSVLEDSLRQLSETQVKAPFNGIITKRYIEIGDLVTGLSQFTSGTSIVRIEDRSKLRIKLEMNEIDVARIAKGMRAEVTIDALPDRKWKGIVQKIAPASTAIAQASQTGGQVSGDAVVKYTVEVYLEESTPEVRTGMTAKCTLKVIDKPSVLRLPIAYVGKDEKGSFVMVAPNAKDPKAKPVRKDIKVGASTGAFVEIVSGIEEGAIVVPPPYNGPKREGMMSAGAD